MLDEVHFDSATAVAGCMPGMLAMLVRDFARAAVRRGLDEDVARRLAIAGVHGAAAVIAREGDPDAVIAVGGHARRHDGGRHHRLRGAGHRRGGGARRARGGRARQGTRVAASH